MGWMPTRPLDGFTVGVTAGRGWEEQARLLAEHGAQVLHGPAIGLRPMGTDPELRRATEALVARPPDLTLLTTGIGVQAWLSAAECLGLGDALVASLRAGRVVAWGAKAAAAAVAAGLPVERLPAGAVLAREEGLAGARVAVQLDGGADDTLVDALARRGAEIVPVVSYRWALPEDPGPALRLVEAACERRVAALTVTSAPAARHLLALAASARRAGELVAALCEDVVPACVGSVSARPLVDAGVTGVLQPDRPRVGAMVWALAQRLGERRRVLVMAGREVVLQGSVVVLDGEPVSLTDQERRLLATLAERPGAVVTKAALLRSVWGAADRDEHAVEVAVARLRQRLGAAGAAIETVTRRGYRLAAGARASGAGGP